MKYILSRSANKLISINTLCDICLTLKITCSFTVGWPGFAKIANSRHLQNLVILTYRILLCQDCYSEWVSTQLCPILCDSMECSLPGSSVHGVFPARILEWVAFPPPGDIPDLGIKPALPASPTVQADPLPLNHWESWVYHNKVP